MNPSVTPHNEKGQSLTACVVQFGALLTFFHLEREVS